MKLSKEVKTALLVLTAIIVVIFGYNYLDGKNIFDSSREIYAVYDDVEGLSGSANVSINGKKIGSIADIKFMDESGKLLVKMRINNDFEFSNKSIAKVSSEGLISGKSMKIIPDYNGRNVKSGDTLRSENEEGIIAGVSERLIPLQDKVESALTEIDTLLHSFNEVMGETGRKDLKGSLSSLNSSLSHLDNSTAQIDKLLSKNAPRLDTTIANLDKTTYNFSKISDSLAAVEIKPLVQKLDNTLDDVNNVTNKLSNGEGSLGKLLNDDKLYDNLNQSSEELEELIKDVKLNPRRYINLKFSIFGGKDKTKPYEKPTNSEE